MKTRNLLQLIIPVGIILTAIFFLSGCTSKKYAWGDTKKGLILKYRMAKDKPYTYLVTSDAIQRMEINEQKIEVTLNSFQEYTFMRVSTDSDPMLLKVSIDTMSLKIKTPMKEIEPEMENVIGKSIDMKLSRLGEESDYEQSSKITYDIGPETRNLGTEFQAFFTNLPDRPIKPGDSWNFQDSIKEESGGNWMVINASNIATLDGYETLGGRECARIIIASTGTVSGKGNTQGVDTQTAGDFTGTETVYFDYKEGVLVKIISDADAKTVTQTSGVRQMTIPATRDVKKSVELVDK